MSLLARYPYVVWY